MSSARITSKSFVCFAVLGAALAFAAPQAPAARGGAADPAQVFQRGQDALAQARLEEAERDFRQVLQLDPQSGAAYANLGVVYMRRRQWTKALLNLEKAERLMPKVAGIRLNIGLAYFRQNEFLKAIAPLASVVRDQPDALQPRYLLGLCYFFGERWSDAVATLEPLWALESEQFPYLYVLSNAAHRAGKKELDERATEQLIKIGNGTPEYHLFLGKYHLNLGQYDQALTEFEAAAKADPKLPFVHFNLGLVHLNKQEYGQARDEFLRDAEVEPDLALDYNELGNVYWLMQDDKDAEKSYREALRRDPRLVDSRLGLAKIYQKQGKYALALPEVDGAVKIDPERPESHYVRGQVLLHLGRKEEARKELEAAQHISNGRQKQAESGTVPSPELLQDAQ
ncbi:MAG TPA: tetratricopeptide repeat protein [Candidatus Sulfotelmatobacter sp.]|nr:tetratricopeptide repeat protein [Candidatus Sulfotelmatobacter sp.]